MTNEILYEFEHRGEQHRLDFHGAMGYFTSDAIAYPFDYSSNSLLAQLLAYVDTNRADVARNGQKIDPIGRERFSARLKSSIDIGNIANSESAELHIFDRLQEDFSYKDSRSADGKVVAQFQACAAPQRVHYVAAIKEARLCVGPFGQAVFDSEDRYVEGVCRGDGILYALCPTYALPALQYFDGKVVSLCSLWSNGYFHWLLEVLPKLLMILRAGYKFEEVDLFLVRQISPPLMEFLSYLGIPEEKVILWNQVPHLKVKRLIVTSSLENYDYGKKPTGIAIEPWASRAMYEHFALKSASEGKKRRIYVDREHASIRKVINNTEVKTQLEKYGFESVALENLNLAQKQSLFSNAEFVVGPAGAGFANLVLCPPGCAALIFYQEGFESNSFWSLCNNNQLLHYHLVCNPSSRYFPSKHKNTINEDFLVDIEALTRTLDFMIQGSN